MSKDVKMGVELMLDKQTSIIFESNILLIFTQRCRASFCIPKFAILNSERQPISTFVQESNSPSVHGFDQGDIFFWEKDWPTFRPWNYWYCHSALKKKKITEIIKPN